MNPYRESMWPQGSVTEFRHAMDPVNPTDVPVLRDMIKIVEDRSVVYIIVQCGSTFESSSFVRAHRLAAELWAAGIESRVTGTPRSEEGGGNVRVLHVPPRLAVSESRDWDGSMRVIRRQVQNYLGDFTEERVS